jgi:uncharacterized OB-fold protein
MAKRNFIIGLGDEKGNVVGTQCAHCSKIVFYQNGVVPADILAEECEDEEDVGQAAARVRGATDKN